MDTMWSRAAATTQIALSAFLDPVIAREAEQAGALRRQTN